MKKNNKKKNKKNKFDINKIIKKNPFLFYFLIVNVLLLLLGSIKLGVLITGFFIFFIDFVTLFIYFGLKSKKKTIWKIILTAIFSFGIACLLLFIGFFMWIAKEANERFDISKLERNEATIIYDKDNNVIAKLGEQKREKITYDELPEVLVNAIIATEDSRFFQHNGFDLPRFAKATLGQLAGNSSAGGASTITMQVAKNNFTSTEASGIEGLIRKFTDIYMSIFKIEKKYTKYEILEFYVNDTYLGARSYGVEQACLSYFGKSAKDVNLAEASLIAGLFQSPYTLDPFKNPEGATERRSTVLYLMKLHGYITEEERQIAEAVKVEDLLVENTKQASYQSFIDTVVEEVKKKTKLDPYLVPMEIYTTMDTKKQEHVDSIMNGENFTWDNQAANAGIIVLDSKTGAIIAVGANRKNDAKAFNYATMIEKQIGSTAKPLYEYGAGIEYSNWDTYHPFADEPYKYSNGKEINNWDGKFQGLITLRKALVGSRNIPALKAFQSLNNNQIKTFATNLGLSPEIESNKIHEAHAIGGYNGESPLTVAGAYATYSNKGVYNEPHSFTKLIYRDTGEVYENKPATRKVMSEETAYMITDMLVDTAKETVGSYASINKAHIATKTGTTNFPDEAWDTYNLPRNAINDFWISAYDPNYTMAIWYGYDLNKENVKNGYVSILGDIQHKKLLKAIGKGIFDKTDDFVKPNNVVEVPIEIDTYPAQLPSPYTPSNKITYELYKKGTEPTDVSNRYQKLSNVTNIKDNVSGNTLNLSWDSITTPDALSTDKITEFADKLFTNNTYKQSYINSRISYNNKSIGVVSYNVYVKNGDGSLSLLTNTKNTNVSITLTSTSHPITYVIKTVYSIFKANISDGAEVTVDFNGSAPIVYAIINGEDDITLHVGDTYTESVPSVFVYDNAIQVSPTSVTREVKNGANQVVSDVNTSQVDTFTITYHVVYNDFQTNVTKTVRVLGS